MFSVTVKARFGKRGRVHVMHWKEGYMSALCGSDRHSFDLPQETEDDITCARCKRMFKDDSEGEG